MGDLLNHLANVRRFVEWIGVVVRNIVGSEIANDLPVIGECDQALICRIVIPFKVGETISVATDIRFFDRFRKNVDELGGAFDRTVADRIGAVAIPISFGVFLTQCLDRLQAVAAAIEDAAGN